MRQNNPEELFFAMTEKSSMKRATKNLSGIGFDSACSNPKVSVSSPTLAKISLLFTNLFIINHFSVVNLLN